MAEQPPAPPAPDAGQNSASASAGSGTPAAGERTFTQAEMEAAIKDRLDRQKRAIEADAAKARKEAEDAQLAAKGEHQQIADRAVAEAATLRPQAERAARLEELIAGHVAAILPTLPEGLRALLPAALPVEDQYAWVIKAQGQAAALAPGRAPAPGLPSGPPPAGQLTRAQQIDAEKQAARASGRFGF